MNYTLWFYDCDGNKKYDVFTGRRSQCYKIRKSKSFSWQYKVLKAIW